MEKNKKNKQAPQKGAEQQKAGLLQNKIVKGAVVGVVALVAGGWLYHNILPVFAPELFVGKDGSGGPGAPPPSPGPASADPSTPAPPPATTGDGGESDVTPEEGASRDLTMAETEIGTKNPAPVEAYRLLAAVAQLYPGTPSAKRAS